MVNVRSAAMDVGIATYRLQNARNALMASSWIHLADVTNVIFRVFNVKERLSTVLNVIQDSSYL